MNNLESNTCLPKLSLDCKGINLMLNAFTTNIWQGVEWQWQSCPSWMMRKKRLDTMRGQVLFFFNQSSKEKNVTDKTLHNKWKQTRLTIDMRYWFLIARYDLGKVVHSSAEHQKNRLSQGKSKISQLLRNSAWSLKWKTYQNQDFLYNVSK